MFQNNKNKTEKRAMKNINFLNRVWNVDLPKNQISANQAFPNENDGVNERYVQIVKLRYTLKESKNVSVQQFIFAKDADCGC